VRGDVLAGDAGDGAIGLPDDIPWLTQLPWAWVALVGVTVWWTLGFNTVIYLAALQDISPELYEAARMDGANRWQRFRNVTLPGLRPVLLFIVSITIIASVNMFGQSFLMTRGARVSRPGRRSTRSRRPACASSTPGWRRPCR
jgi:multiple sugar transport system permease protein